MSLFASLGIMPILTAQVLIKHVTVLDVINRKSIPDVSVLALDGKIVSIEKDRMYKLPAGTEVIDGTGKFLVPGFNDAHVHFFQSGGLYTRPDVFDLRKYHPYEQEIKWVHNNMDDQLRRYLSVGITSVIDVGSTYQFLKQRDSFNAKATSPQISMTGPLLTTWVPPAYKKLGEDQPFLDMVNEDSVRSLVRIQASKKADFIKIWYIVLDTDKEKGARKNLALVKAAIDEAHALHLRVAVHATERITAQLAVENGADFLVHNIEDEVVTDAFIQLLKQHQTVLCPTMVVADNYRNVLSHHYQASTRELAQANPTTLASIVDYPRPDTTLAKQYIQYFSNPEKEKNEIHTDSILRVNLKKLHDGGVVIATGTDAGNIGTQHASSYFNELWLMKDAGLSLWDLLVSSTINGAKALGKDKETGSINKGKTASMVLLHANPLEGLENWQNIAQVINRGKVLQPDTLIRSTPEMLAQQQLNAYNSHDLDAFLAPYSDSVEIYEFPSKLIIKGKEQMRKNYGFVASVKSLYCHLQNRIVQGNIVIDHEAVYTSGPTPFYGIAIYVIEKGKIVKAYFP